MNSKQEAVVYTKEGKEAGKIPVPAAVFDAPWRPNLVHEVVTLIQANARAGTAHTKDRSEVRGGGAKPWRQKGTGRARHGSRRSPIWTGGGVAHGPRNEREYGGKINRNMRARALASVLSRKFIDGEVIFVDDLTFGEPKTTAAKSVLAALATGSSHADLATKRQNAALIVLSERDENTEKSFRNFGNVAVAQAKDIHPLALLTYKYVIVAKPDKAIETLTRRVATKTARKAMTSK